MKPLLMVTLALSLLAGPTRAGSDDWWQGALIGGALGAIVGHNSHNLDSAVAIPAFAVAGALMGYGNDRGWFDNDGYYGYRDPYQPYRYNDRYNRYPTYHPRGYGQYYSRAPVYRHRPSRQTPARNRPQRREPAAPPPNLHPGVETIAVPVTLASGVSFNLSILKVNGRFIGPQGEAYDALPTGEELAAKYLP